MLTYTKNIYKFDTVCPVKPFSFCFNMLSLMAAIHHRKQNYVKYEDRKAEQISRRRYQVIVVR